MSPLDEQKPVNARLDDADRTGLTGTAPANAYAPLAESEDITQPPDGRSPQVQPQWRKDFPIDWPQDDYVARRDFAKFLVLTSAAFAVGQVWILFRNRWRRAREQPLIQKIASLSSVGVGQSLMFSYPGAHDPCVLVRTGEHELVAFSQKCTHLSCAVVPRPEKGIFQCPCHEGVFDLRTGRNLAGPPPRPLPRITLEVHGDDVYATGVELTTG